MLIYLCEDSESDALRLKHHLNTYATKHHCNMEILLFSSGEEMIQYYKEEKRYPALLFLDIYMNNQDGVETARILRSLGYEGGIIFTTSSTEHAMASYEVNALYYLQKPYSHTDFLNAMSRCDTLLEESNEVFTFSVRRKEYSLPYSDILFFETGQHNVLLHAISETFTIPGNLDTAYRGLCLCCLFSSGWPQLSGKPKPCHWNSAARPYYGRPLHCADSFS